MAGIVQGLIHDIPTVAEMIQRIIAGARELIAARLAGVLASPEV
jgi:nitronate monooxygenase